MRTKCYTQHTHTEYVISCSVFLLLFSFVCRFFFSLLFLFNCAAVDLYSVLCVSAFVGIQELSHHILCWCNYLQNSNINWINAYFHCVCYTCWGRYFVSMFFSLLFLSIWWLVDMFRYACFNSISFHIFIFLNPI